jgi:arabinofuranosyltransferase
VAREPSGSSASAAPPLPARDLALCAIAVLAAGVVLLVSARKLGSLQDDAYIYLRYADNLRAGRGLVFNPGERVEGFTSPLWLAILAGAGAVGIAPASAAGVLGALAVMATVLVSAADARRCGPPGWFACLPPIGLATFLPLLLWGVSGLETGVFTALLWGAIAARRAEAVRAGVDAGVGVGVGVGVDVGVGVGVGARVGAGIWLGVLLAAVMLARPEGVLAVLAIGGSAVVARPRSMRRAAAVLGPSVVAGAALLAARALYYHDVLPNTFYAKMGGTWRHASLGARYVSHYLRAAPLVWPAVGLLVGRSGERRCRRVPALGASGALVALYVANVVRIGGDYFQYFRFMVPLTPFLYALGAEGAHALVTAVLARARWSAARLEAAGAAVVGLAVVLLQYDPILVQSQHGLEWCTRWRKLGRALAVATPPGTRVAAPNIGAIGYESGLPIDDLLGLVDRALAHRPSTLDPGHALGPGDIGHDHFDAAWSLDRRPAVVVFMHAVSAEPFTDASELPADLLVERALLARLSQSPDYRLVSLPIEPRQYWGLFVRGDLTLASDRSPETDPPR